MSGKIVDVEETTLFNAELLTGSTSGGIHQHDVMSHYSMWSSFAETTATGHSFTTADFTGSSIKITGHGFATGLLGHLTGTGVALPTGLATATDYYIIRVDADNVQLAASKAGAFAGTFITLTADNTVSGFVPDTIGTFNSYLQASLDGTNYWNVAGTTSTGLGATCTSVANIAYNYVRMQVTLTAGQVTGTVKVRSLGGY